MENDGVWTAESVNGGEDVFSAQESHVSCADHLVVMVHGILGSTENWKFAAEQFVRMLPDKVIVHRSERNMARLTLDGVDVMGERLTEEVLKLVKQKPNLRKISFVAHSVGGLVARYAIGRLYRPFDRTQNLSTNDYEDESKETIGGLVPMNFISMATPHLGSRGNKQVPFLFGVTAFEKLAASIIHWIFFRTGQHLFLTDNDDGKPPLLKRMTEDHDGCYFMSALRSFKRRVAYSNVGCDHIVGWRTSSMRRKVELPNVWKDSENEKYPHIVYEELCKASDAQQELLIALTRVSWEKVDVSFRCSRRRYDAHNIILVKDEHMHSEGADVIQHMIDHFTV